MVKKELVMEFIETLEGLRRYRRWYRGRTIPIRKNEMMLLMFLEHHMPLDSPGLQPSELGKMLRLTRPTITSMVKSLERNGYVVRINDEEDRRVVFVKLTGKGESLVNKSREGFARNIAELIGFLGEKDAEELIRIMGRLRRYMETKNVNQDRGSDLCGD